MADKRNRDLIAIVFSQLPMGLRDKVTVDVEGDAYNIRPKAIFKDSRNRHWEVYLEDEQFEGVPLRCKVPELFIAQLCAVV